MGELFWESANISAIINKEGEISNFIKVSKDITEQKQAEKIIKESEERYRSLVTNLPVGVFRSTPEGKVLSVNPAMVEIYGYDSVEELLNVPAQQFYKEKSAHQGMINKLDVKGFLLGFETLENKKDGSCRIVS